MRTNTIFETYQKMNSIMNRLDPIMKVPGIGVPDQWAIMAGLNSESMQSLGMAQLASTPGTHRSLKNASMEPRKSGKDG